MRDAAPPQIERPARPEGPEVLEAAEEAPTSDLPIDEDAPAGDEVRGDDRDVEQFAAAEQEARPPARKRATKPRAKKATPKRTTRDAEEG
jgi:hypothetical protein